ncbi:MAG: TMEM165/GDT1 family protein [Deltaproteobacteria bacterium]|nr:TMEM165/GDT1 family protein [Deltaproteobacteria bacterium]
MDFKMLITTFGMIFLAELGDKTQLATFCISADCDSKISVFLGSAGALVLSSLIAVLCGTALDRFLPADYIKIGAGLFFVVVGIGMIISAAKVLGT